MEKSGGVAAVGGWKRNVGLFLCGQAVTLVGSSMVGYACVWYMTLETKSGVVMMVFTVASMLPMFFLSPFGGVWADRYNRRNIINTADAFIALVSLVIALLFTFGAENIWLLLACVIARSAGQGVQTPAVSALIPQLVPEEHLVRVNGIFQSIMSVSMIGSPALGGVLLSIAPLQTVLYIDVVTAAIGISILAFLVKVPRREAPADREPGDLRPAYFREMRDGLVYIRDRALVWHLFIFATFFFILLTPSAILTPLQVVRDFGEDVWRLTAIEIAFSVGMMVGGIVIGVWGGFSSKIATTLFGAVMFGVVSIGLGLITDFRIYLAAMFLMGFSVPVTNTPFMAIIQAKADDEYMGRVFGVLTMLSSIAMPIAMLVFGPLGDVVTIDLLLIVSGGIMLAICPFLAADKAIREGAGG
jgi:DHA3 family macrolide efflux protein-like MFS transporter